MTIIKRILKVLSSLGLGVTLLFLIAVILAFATKLESSTSTHLVQAYVYRTGWFDFLLALFALNLSLATWKLRPWRLRHIGVIMIHSSILAILLGAWMTRHYGFEGTLTMDEGESADFITMRDMVLTVYDPQQPDQARLIHPTSLSSSPPREFMNKSYEVPGGGTFTVDRFYTDAQPRMEIKEDGPVDNPGLQLRFQSAMFQEELWLFPRRPGENRRDFNGLLRFEAFEYPDLASWQASLRTASTGSLSFTLSGARRTVQLPSVGDSLILGGGLSLQLARVYRNFSMNEQGALLDLPGPAANPALEFHLRRDGAGDRYLFFRNMPGFDALLGATPTLPRLGGLDWEPVFSDTDLGEKLVRLALTGDGLRVAWLEEGRVREQPVAVGGAPLVLPWMGFQLSVDQVLRKAWRQEEMENLGVKGEMPAVRLRTEKDGVVEQRWLRLGQRKPIQVDGATWLVGLEQNRVALGFNLTLRDFVEDRYPGSMMAAGYASFVLLDDPEQGIQGREIEISMNNTLVHRGYKFFQSSFRRSQQRGGVETTILSVNNDPGHLVVYVGSVFLVLGLIVVFFLKRKLIELERRFHNPGA
ncbi:MAG: hypothetical protein Q8O14_01205 [bacterium]|jgi:hypothetical protein|nr:hypothetical protein [bacterium]